MTSISETLFDTYGDSLMQEYAPYDEAEILAALDRMSMPQDMQIQVCDLLSSCYLRWGTAAFAIGLGLARHQHPGAGLAVNGTGRWRKRRRTAGDSGRPGRLIPGYMNCGAAQGSPSDP